MEKYNYISSLDNNKISLYTLQLANMKRIEENDVVYIFDEVGAGKTISAGLCIIQLLFQHIDVRKFQNVLVITAPSVVQQFQNKLENILELKVYKRGTYNGKDYNIEIKNYDYRNIAKLEKHKYDFIIIDEAHEFLNSDTKRYEELIKLRAKKILFMTATPIKYSKRDLEAYPHIAAEIITKNYNDINKRYEEVTRCFENLNRILFSACENKVNLSGGFNPDLPVTRYFKETVRNIEKTENGNEFVDKEPRRLVPELWEYGDEEDANTFLANKVEECFNGINRFVVFVRLIKDAKNIANALSEKGFINYMIDNEDDKTYCVITSETSNRKELLKKFSTEKRDYKVPNVLILTYKISEQGIDLPLYNYTINYHISASPSQLEQRFGRVDRLNSVHYELNTCFILKKDSLYNDINTANFYMAVTVYIGEFLPLFPSKNCLITLKILNRINDNNHNIILYYNRLLNSCNDFNIIQSVHSIIFNDQEYELYDEIYSLICFYKDKNIEFNDDVEDFKKNMIKQIQRCIIQSQKSQERISWWKDNIDILSNDLFYINTNEDKIDWSKKYHIETINPKEVARNIVNLNNYKEFSETFKKPIEIMKTWNIYKEECEFEEYFEQQFHYNRFNLLFPEDGSYKDLLKNEDILLPYINQLVQTLPFFKMCQEFRNIVQGLAYTDTEFLYQRYYFNPFMKSLKELFKIGDQLNIANEFFKRYDVNDNQFYIKEEGGCIEASNWLKLFFMYSRKEEFAIGGLSNLKQLKFIDKYKVIYTADVSIYMGIKDSCYILSSIYSNIRTLERKIAQYEWKKYQYNNGINIACDGEEKNINANDMLEIYESDYCIIQELKKELNEWKEDENKITWCRSLFHHFRYPLSQGKNGKLRENVKSVILFTGDIRLRNSTFDNLTEAIINDL